MLRHLACAGIDSYAEQEKADCHLSYAMHTWVLWHCSAEESTQKLREFSSRCKCPVTGHSEDLNTCANMRQHCLHRISGHHFVKRVRICTKANLSTPTVQTPLSRQEWRRVPTFRQEETHRSARMPPPSRLVRHHIANAQGFQREDWALCSPDSSEATSTPTLADMETSQLSIALRMLGPEG